MESGFLTNINFTSNVYPVEKSLFHDHAFLNNLHDIEKLVAVNKELIKRDIPFHWSAEQKELIKYAQPYCAYNRKDNCYGLINEEGKLRFVNKCIKKDCANFGKPECGIESTEEEYLRFSHDVNKPMDYDYSLEQQFGDGYDIISEHDSERYNGISDSLVEKYSSGKFHNIDFTIFLDKKDEYSKKEITSEAELFLDDVEEEVIEVFESEWKSLQEESDDLQEKLPSELPEKEIIKESENLISDINQSFKEIEQAEVEKTTSEKNYFIDAGPGTGKTKVLIDKINHLVSELEVLPTGIWVLCFTNSAVSVVRDRLYKFEKSGKGSRELNKVEVRTFHSFAWELIKVYNENLCNEPNYKNISVNIDGQDYDKTIRDAIWILKNFGDRIVGTWEHFIIDELQDLTDIKAELVFSLAECCVTNNCGITFFGDACQGIYDFNTKYTSDKLYCSLFELLADNCVFGKFCFNHRQSGDMLEKNNSFRESILKGVNQDTINVIKEMKSRLSSKKIIVKEKKGYKILCDKDESTCLIFSTNGKMLQMSSTLHHYGFHHTINKKDPPQHYASWIAEVFANFENEEMNQRFFEEKYDNSISKNSGLTGSEVWDRLKKYTDIGNDKINVRGLLNGILSNRRDDPVLFKKEEDKLILSVVHQAKGNEYDNVVIDEIFIDEFLPEEKKEWYEKKTVLDFKQLYVATTRAKTKLASFPLSEYGEYNRREFKSNGKKRWGKKDSKGRPLFFAVSYDNETDIDHLSFLKSSVSNCSDFLSLEIGDEVILKRVINKEDVHYDIICNSTGTAKKIGKMSGRFTEDVRHHTKINLDTGLPQTFDELYITGIYTHIASDSDMETFPEIGEVSKSGVWMWVEIMGIGHASYGDY